VEGADGEGAWAPFPAGAAGGATAAEARAGARAEARDRRAEAEASWREAFAKAKAQVAELEAQRDGMKRQLASPGDLNAYDEARRWLPEVERRLQLARDQLDELERQASLAGVPREWR
jgi:hypothetical protein